MRFRKSIKLFPGLKINLSKTGISTSIGPRGATVNVKPGRKTRLTTGIPGTGLTHTQTIDDPAPPTHDPNLHDSSSDVGSDISTVILIIMGLGALYLVFKFLTWHP